MRAVMAELVIAAAAGRNVSIRCGNTSLLAGSVRTETYALRITVAIRETGLSDDTRGVIRIPEKAMSTINAGIENNDSPARTIVPVGLGYWRTNERRALCQRRVMQ